MCRTTKNSRDLTVFSVTFSPDSTLALSGNEAGDIKLWEVASGRKLRIFAGHTNAVTSVAFSPDGQYVLGSLVICVK